MSRWGLRTGLVLAAYLGLTDLIAFGQVQREAPSALALGLSNDHAKVRHFVTLYCVECHNRDDKAAGLMLDILSAEDIGQTPGPWEKVVRRVATRQMPPPEAMRPTGRSYDSFVDSLTTVLDRRAAQHNKPGRTETFRRLNRTEYQNTIRDLLALEVDAGALLPRDESSQGFDNITVGDLSPTLLDRYITAAQRISRLAVGNLGRAPGGDTFRIRPDITQEEHVEGLPIGTRGGASISYTFPQSGEYDLQIRLARDRNEHVEGLSEPHELVVLLDRERLALFSVRPPRDEHEHQTADAHLKIRLPVKAGPHDLAVTFLKKPSSLLETKRQPYRAHYNMHRHPRLSPALYQLTISGPYQPTGHGDTPSRRRIFVCGATDHAHDEACATKILSRLMRRAYRQPVGEIDLQKPMQFFRQENAQNGFDAGIEAALCVVLVNPRFLFRIETDPPGIAPKSAYRIADLQLASRLSFFLWSSIPDDELLDLAAANKLHEPAMLERQIQRMLDDGRSQSLVTNFASQWLHLRNLESITPDLRLFPDFDDNLRQAFRQETELFFESIMHEDQSVLKLLNTDHTYLNERLAHHYGVPHVYGSRFRRVADAGDHARGGLLRQGSLLTVTSYATRTSPVIRGKWVLENILGTPPPPPLPNVPALKDNTVSSTLSVRERLAEHRRNVVCASCHRLMDPVGFALENFDAVGRWRDLEEGHAVDVTGGLPDGSKFEGVAGLERALLKRPEVFVTTLAEKLLTFALGRGVSDHDAPAIRKIVRDARATNYRFSSLIVGVATSTPFQMRESE